MSPAPSHPCRHPYSHVNCPHLASAASSVTGKLPPSDLCRHCTTHIATAPSVPCWHLSSLPAPSVPCWHLSSLPACPLHNHALPSILSLSGLSTHLYLSLQTNVFTCLLLSLSHAFRHLHIYCPCPSLTSAVTCTHVTTAPASVGAPPAGAP